MSISYFIFCDNYSCLFLINVSLLMELPLFLKPHKNDILPVPFQRLLSSCPPWFLFIICASWPKLSCSHPTNIFRSPIWLVLLTPIALSVCDVWASYCRLYVQRSKPFHSIFLHVNLSFSMNSYRITFSAFRMCYAQCTKTCFIRIYFLGVKV